MEKCFIIKYQLDAFIFLTPQKEMNIFIEIMKIFVFPKNLIKIFIELCFDQENLVFNNK